MIVQQSFNKGITSKGSTHLLDTDAYWLSVYNIQAKCRPYIPIFFCVKASGANF